MKAPHGIKQIIQVFGNPRLGDDVDPAWYRNNIVRAQFPFPMILAWDTKRTVTAAPVHRKLQANFEEGWTRVWNYARVLVKQQYGYNHSTQWYDDATRELIHELHLDLWGGAYAYRSMRIGRKLSAHAFGIAFDVDPANNPMGGKCTLPEWFVDIWCGDDGMGWKAGRDFNDPMHVQFCTGY